MSYTSKSKVENYLTIDIDSSFANQIEDWASAVKLYIDKYTGRTFEAATETRYFDGNGKREIIIDDFQSITTLQILDVEDDDVMETLTEGKAEDYIIAPYNTTPKNKLILSPNSTISSWPLGKRRIKVVGSFGYSSSVPKDIEYVATKLVAQIVEKGLKGGNIQSESLGDYSVTFKGVDLLADEMEIKDILDKYKLWEL